MIGDFMNQFELIFKELNIPIVDLPSNYTPDDFAQQLTKPVNTENEISYSVSTKSDNDSDKSLSNIIYR